jgi:hypothetical protein
MKNKVERENSNCVYVGIQRFGEHEVDNIDIEYSNLPFPFEPK